MLLAKWDNVPAAVSGTVFLDMGSHFGLLSARYFSAVGGKRLSTEIFPMIEPATAFAGLGTGPVNVFYFHGFLPGPFGPNS